MTTQEVAQMIAEVGVPYAYYQFTNDTAKPCPFICFYYADSDDMSADDTNYVKVRRLIVELYTDNKDFEMENTVETVLNNHGLFYSRSEVYIDSERMYEVIFESEVIING
jgi:hypothetical protein